MMAPGGTFEVSQTRLANIWPGGIQKAREKGDRVLSPEDLASGLTFSSAREREACDMAFDWLKCITGRWPHRNILGRYVQKDIYQELVTELRNAFRIRNPYLVSKACDDILNFFWGLSKLFGRMQGIGKGVIQQVLSMGLDTAPLVAFNPAMMCQLTEFMWEIAGYNVDTIEEMIKAVPPRFQKRLYTHCKREIHSGNRSFTKKIVAVISGYPETVVVQLVLSNAI